MMITIRNDGQALVATNYWDSEHAARGLCYLSANAGALRLLVPSAAGDMLADMRTGKRVTIEPSAHAAGLIDIVFDDGTDAPFALAIDPQQIDRPLASGRGVPFTVWTRAGLQLSLTAEVRL